MEGAALGLAGLFLVLFWVGMAALTLVPLWLLYLLLKMLIEKWKPAKERP